MEEQIKKKMEEINKETNSLSYKFEKSTNPVEKSKLYNDLTRLDGRLEAYREVLRMIEGE